MLEPIVQDYIRACTEMDRDGFCRRLDAPVLVARTADEIPTFQMAATGMATPERPSPAGRQASLLAPRMPVLELRKASGGEAYELGVGRSEENDVVILDETVSSRHARVIQERTGVFMLQDLDSTNGTTLNKRPLLAERAVELRDGDAIAFGDAEYVFFTPGGLYDAIEQMVATSRP